MRYRVVVLARARLDVASIYDWIAERSAEGARRWLDQFEKAAAALESRAPNAWIAQSRRAPAMKSYEPEAPARASPPGTGSRWRFGLVSAVCHAFVQRSSPFIAPLAPESGSFDIAIRSVLFRTRSGRVYRAGFTVADEEVRILRVRGPGQPPLKPRDVIGD